MAGLWMYGFAEAAKNADEMARQLAIGRAVLGFLIIVAIVSAVVQISMFRLFRKAGRSGWIAFVPVYNLWSVSRLVGWPGWLGLLCYVPFLGYLVMMALCFGLARSFGKHYSFALMLILFPVIGFPILARNKTEYQLASSPA
jgi:signal peptidase I